MRLPFANEAEVPRSKITRYLLNVSHRSGKSKARFFLGHGYCAERWEDLAEDLRTHARENDIAKQETTPLGVRIVVQGPLSLPDGVMRRLGRCGLLSPVNRRLDWQPPFRCDDREQDD